MRDKEEIKQLIENGKHFCINPWIHLHIDSWGTMTPCCSSTEDLGNLNDHSLNELWQGEAIRRLRLKMLRDESCEKCTECYKNDKTGVQSLRKMYNDTFAKNLEWVTNTDDYGYAPDTKPISWDIRFSNICNLKCRTCSYYSSSSWYHEHKVLKIGDLVGKEPGLHHEVGLQDPERLMKDLHAFFPYVRSIYCAGGEPLLMKENVQLLKELDDIRKYDVRLHYNTNLTQIHKADKFFEYWARMKDLTIGVSLDGSQKRGEYIRKGIVWDNIIRNLIILKQKLPQANIRVSFTVSAFNILHLPDFHKEMVEKGYLAADKVDLNMLHFPPMLNTTVLPEAVKRDAESKILEHISWIKHQPPFNSSDSVNNLDYECYIGQWYACIKHINSEDCSYLIPAFKGCVRKLDELRNESCLDVFPELEPILGGK